MCVDFFDRAWNHLDFHEPRNYPFSKILPARPSRYDSMWAMANKLSEGKAFVRVDFYQVDEKIYFGEITFFPTSGMGGFEPDSYDDYFGSLIDLPKRIDDS